MSIASFVFNETSPATPTTLASSQSVAGSGQAFPLGVAGPLDDYEALLVTADLVGATGGTLDVYLQTSPDQGANWYDFAHFTPLAAAAPAVKYTLTASLYTQLPAPVVVGKNLAPVLAANTFVNGAFTDRMRLVMVAGAGTSAGAAVKVSVMAQRTYPRP
jgi:hypothetical protein